MSDELFDDAAVMLFQLGRAFARLAPAVAGDEPERGESGPAKVQLCLAVDRGREAHIDVTIGWVAGELGIDASSASRLAGQTLAAGLIARETSRDDRRRVILVLTEPGSLLARQARRYQREVFDQLTDRWTMDDRRTFARLFITFADRAIERLAEQRDKTT